MKKLSSLWKNADKKTGVWAAVFCCLTLFSIVAACVPTWYDKLPKVSEFICGQVLWTGYAKQSDLQLVKCILVGLPVLYLFFMCLFCLIRQKGNPDRVTCVLFGSGYLGCLLLGMVRPEIGWQYGLIFVLFVLGYYLGRGDKRGLLVMTDLRKALYGAVYGTLSFLTVLFVMSFALSSVASLWQTYSYVAEVLFAVLFLLFAALWGKTDALIDKMRWLQVCFPFVLLGMIHFRYAYEGQTDLMELFYSGRWKLFCLGFAVMLSAICIWQLLHRRSAITVSTFVIVAMLRVFTQPDGILNIDFFHNGELSLPMQQLSSYGRLPYQGLVPIHGMCDYFFGAIDALFFDGSYLALNAAKVVGNILMAAFLAVIIYYFVSGHLQGLFVVYLFMPYLIQTAGMRYLFLFTMFFVLFSTRMRDGVWHLYAWILLSIFATAWNASIGGAAAIAFLPVVLYRCIKKMPGQCKALLQGKKSRKALTFSAWLFLLCLGIAYIPMFLQIVVYLVDNTGTTLYVNGMEMFQDLAQAAGDLVPGIVGTHGSFFLVSFGFVIPLLLCLYFAFEKGGEDAREYFVTLLCCFFVLINYAFVRFDEGLRATVMGVFFTLIVLVALLYDRGERAWKRQDRKELSTICGCYAACLFVLLHLMGTSPGLTSESLSLKCDVPGEIETTIRGQQVKDPVVYVTGESVQMPGLGCGFVQGNTLASLQNLQYVLGRQLAEGETCLDLTNEIACNVIFDRDNFWSFTSAYNVSNERMQKKAIQILAGGLPDLILAAPAIVFDETPFSLRCPILYQYLMEQGYRPYKYQNVIYLCRENMVEEAKEDEWSFAELMHKKNLGYLPAIWGSSIEARQQLAKVELPCQIMQTEQGITIRFQRPVSGKDLTMLLLQLPLERKAERTEETVATGTEKAEETVITVSWKTPISQDGEAFHEFYADDTVQNEIYAIPLGLTPYFGMTEQIKEITICYDVEKIQVKQEDVSCYFGKLVMKE